MSRKKGRNNGDHRRGNPKFGPPTLGGKDFLPKSNSGKQEKQGVREPLIKEIDNTFLVNAVLDKFPKNKPWLVKRERVRKALSEVSVVMIHSEITPGMFDGSLDIILKNWAFHDSRNHLLNHAFNLAREQVGMVQA